MGYFIIQLSWSVIFLFALKIQLEIETVIMCYNFLYRIVVLPFNHMYLLCTVYLNVREMVADLRSCLVTRLMVSSAPFSVHVVWINFIAFLLPTVISSLFRMVSFITRCWSFHASIFQLKLNVLYQLHAHRF